MSDSSASQYCDRCGEPAGTGEHAACRVARELEPPRFCAHCRRRMVVQVTPRSWSARCSEHGTLESSAGSTSDPAMS